VEFSNSFSSDIKSLTLVNYFKHFCFILSMYKMIPQTSIGNTMAFICILMLAMHLI
jgi:hypothetical protein